MPSHQDFVKADAYAAARANEQAIIDDILSGQYVRPVRVVAFNTDDGWSRDVW